MYSFWSPIIPVFRRHSLRILVLVKERSDVLILILFLFVELKQYLSGGARLNNLPLRAVQRPRSDARKQTGHGRKVQGTQQRA